MSDSPPADSPNRRLAEIFADAVDRPPGERNAFLAAACANDTVLRQRLDALLAAHAKASGFLDTGLSKPATAATTLTAPLTEGPGARIGRYKLLQPIGEGGFGAVFMAEQQEPVRRRVALKIIKLGMDTRQVIARFEAERQALAMMDHPHIAKVLDAGATDTGRPYFVMELVKGVPITEYADANRLTTRQRLELFVPVCRAVQHAHGKGIIHRDIKPGNVLVTLHDGVAVPKVIDFGIAKATEHRLTEKTLFTEFRQFIGTPEYMSPEQAEMSGLDIDTRSDIYSLGVLLYELLTGTTPFDSVELRRKAYGEIQRIIREVEPPRPSIRISTLGETLTTVAAHRQIDPARLGRQIRGDLDWIVMKALEKDRTRRYDTAADLAADVTRHLAGDPVVAAPPGAGYVLQKLMRRYWKPLTAAAAVVCLLIAGLVVVITLLNAERRAVAHARALEAHQRSLLDAARRAEQTARDALRREQEQRHAAQRQRDAATDSLSRIANQLRDQVLATTGAHLNKTLADGSTITQLDITFEPRAGQEVEALGSAATHLADKLTQALTRERDQRRSAEAVTSFVIELLSGGDVKEGASRPITITEILKRAEEQLKTGLESEPALEARLRHLIGELYVDFHFDPEMSVRHLDRAVALRSEHLGPNHVDTGRSQLLLAKALHELYARGRFPDAARRHATYQRAADMAARAVSVLSTALGRDHREAIEARAQSARLIMAWCGVDSAASFRRRYADAEAVFRDVIESCNRLSGDQSHETARAMAELADCLERQDRYADAVELQRRVLRIYTHTLGESHAHTDGARERLATNLMRLDSAADAVPLLQIVVEHLRHTGERGNRMGQAQQRWGLALVAVGRYSDAEAALLAAHDNIQRDPAAASWPADFRRGVHDAITSNIVMLYRKWDRADPGNARPRDELARWTARLAGIRAVSPALTTSAPASPETP